MKILQRLLALLLALVLAGPLGSAAAIDPKEDSAGDSPLRAVVVFSEGSDAAALEETLSALPGTEVLWRYDALLSGLAVEAPVNVLRGLETLEGVARVGRSASRLRAQDIHSPLTATNSLPMMNAEAPEQTGDGMVIAVLDDSLRLTHEAFGDYGLVKHPAISRQDTVSLVSRGGAPGRWVSEKVPFVYDYAGRDTGVSAQEDHGTHVSALAAGYARGEDGETVFTGAAPAAQLVFMKVFTDGRDSRADDTVILRALEDAYRLGADVINLSLGVDGGFTEDAVLEEIYGDIFRRLAEEGVLVFCAAGNSGAPVTQKLQGVPLPSAEYPDYGSVSAPGTYRGAVPVAAADAMERQSAGGILAGGRRWAFADSAPEEGCEAPALETLADRELPFVSVGGVGAPKDYEGLDAVGAVVLVERGELTFTEKTRNAAAAGAAACLVYNNALGSVTPSVEDLPIPCAVISKNAGAALLELERQGENTLTVRRDAYIETLHESPAAYEYSAWGTTSDLRLAPALTAPGGAVLSAGAGDDSAYVQLSGTSMASPNASGAAAGVLQALRERAPELTKARRGALALALLESTAELIRTEEGVPLSPRRQGAGLVNQGAALAAQVVIEAPLLELGESPEGTFPLKLQVQNLTDQPLALTAEVQVLTDRWVEEEGRAYSALEPLDITDKTEISGERTLRLPAGGTGELTLTVQVTPEAREELGAVFTNGFFVEGFVTLSGEDTVPIHASFLGFCGDWRAAPILELQGVELDPSLVYQTGGVYGFDWEDGPLLGENRWGELPAAGEYGALSTEDSGALLPGGTTFVTQPVLLRSAAHLVMLVRDRDSGELYAWDDTPWLPKSGILNGEVVSHSLFFWDGRDEDGEPLPEGTAVTAEFYAWLDSDGEMQAAYEAADPEDWVWLTEYGDRLAWSFPAAIDGTAPTVAVGTEEAGPGDSWTGEEALVLTPPEKGGETLAVTLRDNQYLARAAVYGPGEEPLAELLFAPEEAGKTYTLRLGFPEEMPERLWVTASDYAGNTTGLEFDLGDPAAEPSLCPAAMFTDVAKGAWYHRAVDYLFDRGLIDGEDLAFRPGETASRAELLDALYRAAGRPELQMAPLTFLDVPSNAWYRDAVNWACELGIATGLEELTFGALAPVTREQMAVILYRCATLGAEVSIEGDLSAFADGERAAPWAREALCWAVGEGILSGDGSGRLNPEGYATRGELAEVLTRYLES